MILYYITNKREGIIMKKNIPLESGMENEINVIEHGSSIFDLPYDQVVELYRHKLEIEQTKCIRRRTAMLRQYPDLFDSAVQDVILAVIRDADKINKNRATRTKVIEFDFTNKTRKSSYNKI